MQQVIVYVDGFNLYYGLRSANWRRYYWLNLRLLAENLLGRGQSLAAVRYFSAHIQPERDDPDKPVRQQTYLEALATLPGLHVHHGYFLHKVRSCPECGAQWKTYEEKMTDVNIAVELLGDASDGAFDTAIIISADSDLAGPISTVRQRFPEKRTVVAFPPRRASKHLSSIASASFTIGRKILSDSQFPDEVTTESGYTLVRPANWT